MFNLKKDEIKTTTEQLAQESRAAVDHLANEGRDAVDHMADKVAEKSEDFKGQANHLISSLKNVIQDYTNTSKIEGIQEDISNKAAAIKTAVTDEFSNVYSAGKTKAEVALRDNPLATLAVVAGAGLVIGYLLGSKQSSK